MWKPSPFSVPNCFMPSGPGFSGRPPHRAEEDFSADLDLPFISVSRGLEFGDGLLTRGELSVCECVQILDELFARLGVGADCEQQTKVSESLHHRLLRQRQTTKTDRLSYELL